METRSPPPREHVRSRQQKQRMPTVYAETTAVGIIAARDHSDPVVLARQTVSQEWHATATVRYKFRVSD